MLLSSELFRVLRNSFLSLYMHRCLLFIACSSFYCYNILWNPALLRKYYTVFITILFFHEGGMKEAYRCPML